MSDEDIEQIPVFFDRYLVGNLHVDRDGNLSFAYERQWQATTDAFGLSVTMPLARNRHGPDTVHSWITNLLPEEAPLAILARVIGVERSDVVAILKKIGGDTAGAFSFGEPSLRAEWRYTPIESHYAIEGQGAALRQHFSDLAQRPFMAGEDGVRVSLAGGQQKSALAVLGMDGLPKLGLPDHSDTLAIPQFGAPSTIILKPDNPHLPGIVENEAYCLALAASVGIDAAQAGVLDTGTRKALVVARYDRKYALDGQLQRLHQEDFAQINHFFPGQKYERGTITGPSLKLLLATRQILPPVDALKLLDQMIFNILVANTDAHAKNYSLLIGQSLRLAPLYDVSTVLPWPHVNQYFAQNIAGRKRKPGDIAGRHWDRLAEESGLNPRATKSRVEELVDLIVHNGHPVSNRLIETGRVNAPSVTQARDCIEVNALRILGRLKF